MLTERGHPDTGIRPLFPFPSTIGVWCNGNTRASKTLAQGSIPCAPAQLAFRGRDPVAGSTPLLKNGEGSCD